MSALRDFWNNVVGPDSSAPGDDSGSGGGVSPSVSDDQLNSQPPPDGTTSPAPDSSGGGDANGESGSGAPSPAYSGPAIGPDTSTCGGDQPGGDSGSGNAPGGDSGSGDDSSGRELTVGGIIDAGVHLAGDLIEEGGGLVAGLVTKVIEIASGPGDTHYPEGAQWLWKCNSSHSLDDETMGPWRDTREEAQRDADEHLQQFPGHDVVLVPSGMHRESGESPVPQPPMANTA
jgi:hypothetical protein